MNEMKDIQDRNKIEMNNNLNNNSYMSKKQVNNANNTNLVKNAAEIASKTNNPYAKAIGEGVKIADKVSGGRASEKLGKVLTTANKLTPGGRSLQRMSNFFGNSNLGNRISNALGKKNSMSNTAKTNSLSNIKNAKDNSSETSIKEKTEEETDNKGYTSFATSFKVVKIGMIVFCGVIFPIVIFCCCFISASQTFLSAVGIQNADNIGYEEAENKIRDIRDEDRDQEIKDEQAYDIYITDEKSTILKNSKLSKNIIQIARRKYDEKLIEQLRDFYPAVEDLSKNYDENMVYDFFLKMHKLYMNYSNVYNVELDLPLLMSTLYIQSSDMNEIFESNLDARYRTGNVEDIPVEELDFYVDWSTYKLSSDDSQHDMEVLAQHMVSLRPNEECLPNDLAPDGKCYKYDKEKYKEFLKQFIEKKYYLDEDNYVEYENVDNVDQPENNVVPEEKPPVENETPNEENPGENTENNDNVDKEQVPAVGDFRTWTQCRQSWSDKIVPKSKKTMCDIGCLITAISIQIARSGTTILTDTIDPGIAADTFNFAKGGNLYWRSTTNLAPYFQYKTKISLLGMSKESIAEKLTSYDPNRYYIILGVGKHSRGKLHHYVALDYVDTETNNIYIMDPSGVQYTDLYKRYKLYRAHIYEKKD